MKKSRRPTWPPRRPDIAFIVDISDILETNRDAVRVMVKKTGLPCWLPRDSVRFFPGSVSVPEWLYRKIMSRAHGKPL